MSDLRVLLVDDEVELAQTLAERLEIRKIFAEVVSDKEAALERIKRNRYDIILLDVVLQRCHGLEILKEIKKIRPEQIVILVSGRGSEADFAKSRQCGAHDYLIKPVQIEKLIEIMEKAAFGVREYKP
jgi:DNA-binding response OmpR family regulator